jgi:hypothetical protein
MMIAAGKMKRGEMLNHTAGLAARVQDAGCAGDCKAVNSKP